MWFGCLWLSSACRPHTFTQHSAWLASCWMKWQFCGSAVRHSLCFILRNSIHDGWMEIGMDLLTSTHYIHTPQSFPLICPFSPFQQSVQYDIGHLCDYMHCIDPLASGHQCICHDVFGNPSVRITLFRVKRVRENRFIAFLEEVSFFNFYFSVSSHSESSVWAYGVHSYWAWPSFAGWWIDFVVTLGGEPIFPICMPCGTSWYSFHRIRHASYLHTIRWRRNTSIVYRIYDIGPSTISNWASHLSQSNATTQPPRITIFKIMLVQLNLLETIWTK